jgi:hypothetical protein
VEVRAETGAEIGDEHQTTAPGEQFRGVAVARAGHQVDQQARAAVALGDEQLAADER